MSLDTTEAVRWYTLSAVQGNATAQNNMGYCCANGLGIETNREDSVSWYQKAAEQGTGTVVECYVVCC